MHFLERAETSDGYPCMEFESFYQHGMSCFVWGLPKPLVRQSFQKLCNDWKAQDFPVETWHLRAFAYGLAGLDVNGRRDRWTPEGFSWPEPPDASWELVVCIYPDGACELDFLHPVSGKFWSDDNDFLELPTDDRLLMGRDWFEKMGFDLLFMQPDMKVIVGEQEPHLKLV